VTRYTHFRYESFCLSGRSCRACPVTCARSFPDSPHHYDSQAVLSVRSVLFPFYTFSIYAAIFSNATPAYIEGHLVLIDRQEEVDCLFYCRIYLN
jgi:hypothetical protein